MKTCKKCNIIQADTEFYYHEENKDKLTGSCKTCKRKEGKAHRSRNIEKRKEAARLWRLANPGRKRETHVKNVYGISESEYRDILDTQDGCCAICKIALDSSSPGVIPHIDHDHTCCESYKSCGKCVRGLLCRGCNALLGMSKDRPEVLRSAADYVEFYKLALDVRRTL